MLGPTDTMNNPPELIDICVNLSHESFRKDETAVMERAQAAGVSVMLCPGSSIEDSEAGLTLARRYPGRVYTGIGVHPHLAKTWNRESEQRLLEMARDSSVRTLGECGLDYNRNYSPQPQQRAVFDAQLDLAYRLNLPVLLHERDAHEDFLDILKSHRDRLAGGVAHCFTGDRKALFAYLDLDLHIGVTGWICDERRGQHLKELIRHIPRDRLLLETDAPYLLPRTLTSQPKERRNEPAYLTEVLAAVSQCTDSQAGNVAQTTTANARRLFRLT